MRLALAGPIGDASPALPTLPRIARREPIMIRPLLVGLLLAGPALADGAMPLVCAGSGRLITSEVTGTFPTHRYTVPGSATDDPASIEIAGCGREITVGVRGHRLHLVPNAVGPGWSGTLRIDGYDVQYGFRHVGPHLLVGSAVVYARGGRMDADVRLVVAEGRAPAMAGCSDDAPEPLPARGTSVGRAALAEALSGSPLPAGMDITDFVAAGSVDSVGTERVHVLLSEAGDILPLQVPALTPDAICAGEVADVEPPRAVLDFEFMRFDGDTNVFVRRIDIETGRIVEQHEVVARGDDPSRIAVAMSEAMSRLQEKPGGFAAGRDGGAAR